MAKENAGYTITDSFSVSDNEIVIGDCKDIPAPYVCWQKHTKSKIGGNEIEWTNKRP